MCLPGSWLRYKAETEEERIGFQNISEGLIPKYDQERDLKRD